MSEERELEIMTSIGNALPKMSAFDKGYLLGKTEQILQQTGPRKDDENAESKVSQK